MTAYLDEQTYTQLVSWIVAAKPANVEPSPICGTVTDNEVMIALGEVCDIWPESIRPLAEVMPICHRRKAHARKIGQSYIRSL